MVAADAPIPCTSNELRLGSINQGSATPTCWLATSPEIPTRSASSSTRHRDRLWAVALRTLGNPDDAADALQDALLSAYRGAAGFRGNSAVTTWLHRIVVNACLDLARRKAVRPTQPLP